MNGRANLINLVYLLMWKRAFFAKEGRARIGQSGAEEWRRRKGVFY